MASIIAQVEPLPFVPATWMTFTPARGVGTKLAKYSAGLLESKFDTKLLGPVKPVDCFFVGHLHGMVGHPVFVD